MVFVPKKTYSAAVAMMKDKFEKGVAAIPLRGYISLLGLHINEELRFDKHMNKVGRIASLNVKSVIRFKATCSTPRDSCSSTIHSCTLFNS